jgi:TRAP transporter 4TM/12TM fusion protein
MLYYAGVFFMVDFEAVKRGLYGLPRDQLPKLRVVLLREGHLLLPIAVLFYFLIVAQVSPLRAAIWATVSVWLFALLRRATWMGPRAVLEALINGPKSVVTVAITCAAAGVVIGVMLLTGLGHRFAVMLIAFSGGELLPALILAMVASLILGMGLPPVAAYAITGTAIAPALVQLGAPVLGAHMFVFFFSAISVITPPVAIAAFAAAAIAQSNMWKVGITAFRMGIAAYLVPYMFVYGPALLMIGPWWQVVLVTGTAITGIACLAGALQGWFFKPITLPLRAILIVAALALVVPTLLTDAIGFGAIAIFATLAYFGIGIGKQMPRPAEQPAAKA